MKLNLLNEMDDRLRRLKRQAQSDPSLAAKLEQEKLRTLEGWRKDFYHYLEMIENGDTITGAILPNMIATRVPPDVQMQLCHNIIQRLMPEHLAEAGPYIEAIRNKDYATANRWTYNLKVSPLIDQHYRPKTMMDSYIRLVVDKEVKRHAQHIYENLWYSNTNQNMPGWADHGKNLLKDELKKLILN